MSKHFEFKVDEDAKPLTKKEAMEAERKLIQWIFSHQLKCPCHLRDDMDLDDCDETDCNECCPLAEGNGDSNG